MQCPRCNWQNPASYTHCFSCNAALPMAAVQVATQAPAPAAPLPAASADEVFAGSMARLGATAVDAAVMVAASALLMVAWVGGHQVLREGPWPVLSGLGVAVLGLFVPAAMDAWGHGSPGKRLFHLRVVTARGERPGIVRASARHVLKYALNLGLPFLFHKLQALVFGDRSLHNWATGAYVVSTRASDAAVLQAIGRPGRGERFAKGLALFLAGGMALTVLTLVVPALLQDESERAAANPAREATRRLHGAAKPVTQLVQNHYQRTGAFPADAQAMGLGALPQGFSAIAINPANGVVRLTIGDVPEAPALAGTHLTYTPVLRTRKDRTEISKWLCGSDDIPRADRSFTCRHEATGAAR